MGRQVSSVFYGHLVLFLQFGVSRIRAVDNAPILGLHLGLRGQPLFFEPEAIVPLEILRVLGEGLDVVTLNFLVEGLCYN